MSSLDPITEHTRNLLLRYNEQVNMQVRGLMEAFGIDIDAALEAAELGVKSEELEDARRLLRMVMPDALRPILSVSAQDNFVSYTLSEPKRHRTPIIGTQVASTCTDCGATFDYKTQEWSHPCEQPQH